MATRFDTCKDVDLNTREDVCTVQAMQSDKFTDVGDYPCVVFIQKNTNDVTWIKVIGRAVWTTDRIRLNRDLYLVEELIDGVCKVHRDGLESSLLKLQNMGVTIEKGIKVPVKNALSPEDNFFVDQWVGVWTKNVCENYHNLLNGKSLKHLKGKYAGTSAIVVGAGPSLDKNIYELQGINAVIIATDRAYKPLLNAGIVPDYVISVDCHDTLIMEYLDKVDSSAHTLILNSASDYQISKAWKGEILYYNMSHAGMQFCDKVLPFLFPNLMAVANAGCVANTAVIIAKWLGCSRSILVGCDFSYPEKRMSCNMYDWIDGNFKQLAVDEEERFNKRSGKIKKNGIYTYPPFLDYEDTMKVLSKCQDFEVINATEGGIIDSFPMMELKDAKKKYCTKPVGDLTSKI